MSKLNLSKLSPDELDQLFDQRNVDRYISKGMITQKDVDEFWLAKMPDLEKETVSFAPKQPALNDKKIVIKDWSAKNRHVRG